MKGRRLRERSGPGMYLRVQVPAALWEQLSLPSSLHPLL